MSLTYSAAVEQTITAGEQIHQIVNGTATTEVTVEDGSKVPSIRKALLDNFYFKDPIAWQAGQTENVFNQLRQFTDGSWWYAPSATASNPISMGSTPVGDSLWKIYDFDAIGKLTPQIREALRRSYAEAGYTLVDGSFETGGTVTDAADVLLYEASGTVYVWLGALPKPVPAGSSPETTGGISPAGDWVDVGDASLRSQLSSQNSGVIVDDSNIKVSHPESYGITRSLHEKNADIISVKDFGAVGDGVADDTAAIQKAIDTGKTVCFPDGIYKTSATLNVTGSQSISMYGGSFGSIYADRGAVIRYTGASGPLLRVVGGAIGFKVSGLYFDTNNAVALDLGCAWYVKVHDCVFTDASIGVYLHYDAPDYFSGATEVTSCYFGRCTVGVKTSKVDINVIHVTNCTFFAGTNGVELGDNEVASSTRNIVIRDNLFESNTGYDVASYGGAQQLLVDGNYFEENTPSVLARVYVVGSIKSPLNCAVTVTNNTFSKNTSGDLIFVDCVSGLEIKQNWSAFDGIGFIRAYNLVDYNIERCTTVSGGAPCGIVINNVLMNYESVSSRKSIEIGDKFDMVDSSQVQVAASVRAAITFNGVTGVAEYSRLCSVAKLSTGKYRITFTNEMPNGAYILNGLIVSSNNGSRLEIVITTKSYCEVQVVDHTGVLRDSPRVSVSIIL